MVIGQRLLAIEGILRANVDVALMAFEASLDLVLQFGEVLKDLLDFLCPGRIFLLQQLLSLLQGFYLLGRKRQEEVFRGKQQLS